MNPANLAEVELQRSPRGIEQILDLHDAILLDHEDPTVLDENLLASVHVRPQTVYFGEEQYPGLFLKAAVLLQSSAGQQIFLTGNKRTGWEVVRAFLGFNGYRIAVVTSKDESDPDPLGGGQGPA